ncbi:hypothetical protein PFISCL1PPCAC_23230, partial [Pristionchus fissidentatus]
SLRLWKFIIDCVELLQTLWNVNSDASRSILPCADVAAYHGRRWRPWLNIILKWESNGSLHTTSK